MKVKVRPDKRQPLARGRSVGRRTSGADRKDAVQALIDYLKRPGYEPIPQRTLLHRLHVGPEDRPALRQVIRRLIREGRLLKVRGGRLVPHQLVRPVRQSGHLQTEFRYGPTNELRDRIVAQFGELGLVEL